MRLDRVGVMEGVGEGVNGRMGKAVWSIQTFPDRRV